MGEQRVNKKGLISRPSPGEGLAGRTHEDGLHVQLVEAVGGEAADVALAMVGHREVVTVH